ncbi:Protein kinase domain-containing protein [Fusarium sp. Ph1]|nr:Protein kinase domain-containing protein [Fusarium sp. Ph1]
MSGKGPSLDSRFKPQGRELTLIKGLLVQLRNYLQEFLENENDEKDRLAETKRSVDAVIDNLASVAVAVRQTGRKSRLIKADRSFDSSKLEDLRTHLQCIILISQCPPGQDVIDHENHPTWWQEQINGRLTTLQRRLVDANLRRRHRFQYVQRHSMKLASRQQPRPTFPQQVKSPQQPNRAKVRASEARSSGKTNHSLTRSLNLEPVEPPRTLSGTSASIPESNFRFQEAQGVAPVAKSQITSITGVASYPKLSKFKVSDNERADVEQQKITKCPCCCEALPNIILETQGAWKKHLSADIYPYTCIAEHCPTPHVLYRTRSEWEDHVAAHHPKKWKCQLCDTSVDMIFSSVDRLQLHVAEEHLESFPEDLLDTVVFWPSIPFMGLERCPLCFSTGPTDDPELIDHILTHAHNFALRSLPWADNLVEHPRQPTEQFYNLNYVASAEPQEEHASLLPWRVYLWFQQLEIPESEQWEDAEATLSKMAASRKNLDHGQPLGYFATNIYFDLEAHGESLGLEGQRDSEVSERSMEGGKSYTYEGEGLLPVLDNDDRTDLRALLHHYSIEGCDGQFWTEKLLRQILTKERVEAELWTHGFSTSDTQDYLDIILASPTEERPEAYLRVFTLLVLVSRVSDIGKFITENAPDEELPLILDLDSPNRLLSLSRERTPTLEISQKWNWDQKLTFVQSQWRLIFPFLGVSEHHIGQVMVLEPDIARPWRDGITESYMGMFETVSCVEIHPTAHSFDKALSEVSKWQISLFLMGSLS